MEALLFGHFMGINSSPRLHSATHFFIASLITVLSLLQIVMWHDEMAMWGPTDWFITVRIMKTKLTLKNKKTINYKYNNHTREW